MFVDVGVSINPILVIWLARNIKNLKTQLFEYMRYCFGGATRSKNKRALVLKSQKRLDALCNVAGILKLANSHEMALDDWNLVMAVNLTGTFFMSQQMGRHLIAAGRAGCPAWGWPR